MHFLFIVNLLRNFLVSKMNKDNRPKQTAQHSSSEGADCLICEGRADGSAREASRYQPALCRGSRELAHPEGWEGVNYCS